MLQILVESRAARPRRAAWTAFSFLAHATSIVGAISLTARASPDARQMDPLPDVVYVAPQPATPSALAAAPVDVAASISIPWTVLTIPAIIPPPIATPTPDFLHRVVEDLTRTAVGTMTRGNSGSTVVPGGIHTAETVDRIVTPLPDNPLPVYPTRLSAARVEGGRQRRIRGGYHGARGGVVRRDPPNQPRAVR